jgi:hypothetical protein
VFIMRQATVRSRCECQSTLVATLDDERQVVHAYVLDKAGEKENAPGHSIGASKGAARFDIGWLCPVCGRNTLRSFDAESLAYVEVVGAAPIAAPAG